MTRERQTLRINWAAMALAAIVLALPEIVSAGEIRLADDWEDPAFRPQKLQKLLIIGITDLTEVRTHFENKFVSHLRGRKIDGVTSYSIVPQLDKVEDRKAIVRALAEEGVSGAITVRLVPLEGRTEEDWVGAWHSWVGSKPRVRGLIEETLPVPKVEAKRYGVEVALWESSDWNMVWAARTDAHKRKDLEGTAGTFVQLTMAALRDARLL